jgi:hypothetical protein
MAMQKESSASRTSPPAGREPMREEVIYNCHVHIFNHENVPDDFLFPYSIPLVRNKVSAQQTPSFFIPPPMLCCAELFQGGAYGAEQAIRQRCKTQLLG